MDHRPLDVTELLRQVMNGKRELEPKLYDLVYKELRRLAGHAFRNRRAGSEHTPTSLVHETYIRLSRGRKSKGTELHAKEWASREDFYRYATKVMRNLLVDDARQKVAQKRGGGQVRQLVDGEDAVDSQQPDPEQVLLVNAALEELHKINPRQAEIVTLLHYGGLTMSAVADTLGVSQRTIEREWQVAKGWLNERLK